VETLDSVATCKRRMYVLKFDTHESTSQVLWKIVEEEFNLRFSMSGLDRVDCSEDAWIVFLLFDEIKVTN
jgi:hypothetical protein